MSTVYDLLNKLIGIGSLLLVICGLLGNAFTCYVCLQKRLRDKNTFLFLSILSVIDIGSLMVWNLDQFLLAFYNYLHEYTSLWWCRASVFVQYFSLQYSAWLLVLISIDRYLSIRIKGWRTNYFRPNRALVVGFTLGLIIFVINHHLLYLNGYIGENNGTEAVLCYRSSLFERDYIKVWHIVHTFIYSLIPFIVLVCVNSMLIFRAITSGPKSLAYSQSASRNARKKTLTSTIVSLTIMFILTTLPYTLVAAIWYRRIYAYPLGKLLINSLSLLSFSYHSFNFFILFLTNKLFLNECRLIFSKFMLKGKFEININSSTN